MIWSHLDLSSIFSTSADELTSLNKSYNQRLNFLIYKRGINQELHDWNTCCSVSQLCSDLCEPMDWNMPDFPVFTISWSLLKLMFTESVIPSNHLILCHPLLLLPSIFPSTRIYPGDLSHLCIRYSKYWSFTFSISPSDEYSGLISFGIDWLDLLAVQATGI